MKAFVGFWPRQLAVAEDFQQARSVVTAFIADQSRRQQEELDQLERRKRYEGSTAVDDDGRGLDRKGFDAANTSLLTLASFQAGHFQRIGRYATNLEALLPTSMAGLIEIDPAQITVNTNDPGDEYWMYTGTAGSRPPGNEVPLARVSGAAKAIFHFHGTLLKQTPDRFSKLVHCESSLSE